MLRVLLLTRYGTAGASSRVRHFSQLPYLKSRGFSFKVDCLIDNESISRFYAGRSRRWDRVALCYARRFALLPRLSTFDLLWVEKEVLPGLPWSLERLFYGKTKTIVDFDDLWVKRHPGKQSGHETEKFRRLLNAATVVTAANNQLAGALERMSARRPLVLPNTIDTGPFRHAATEVISPLLPSLHIGWIGTPYTAAMYLPPLVPILNRLAAEGISATRLIGAGVAVPDLVADRVPWTLEGEASAVANLDIGIMPLGRTEFDACKSGWKVLQYMAAGLPVVATRIGFNAELINDGVTGFLVETDTDWETRLRQLAKEPKLRATMGAAAQTFVAQRFDGLAGAKKIEQLMLRLSSDENEFEHLERPRGPGALYFSCDPMPEQTRRRPSQ